MKKAVFYLSLFTFLSSCQGEELPRGLPACVKEKIIWLQNQPTQNPPAEVWQYQYQGQTVYYLPPSCCDQMSQLYDENCNLICSPDGGLTGKGDGKCTDFFEARTDAKLVWSDKK